MEKRRIRKPRYAPEFLERRVSPSDGIGGLIAPVDIGPIPVNPTAPPDPGTTPVPAPVPIIK